MVYDAIAETSDDDKAQHKKEFEALTALFVNFLKNIHSDSREEAEYALMELRADLIINHAYDGFQIDEEEALQLLKNIDDNSLTKEDKEKRDRLVAAVENLIMFAVCEEYHVAEKATSLYHSRVDADEDYDIDFNDPDDIEGYDDINALYNDAYALVENGDVAYAMGVARMWLGFGSDELLTYWTMNDAKVRPWHMALQGYTARRDEFPSWMIPPIEYNCRCFLISSDSADEVWNKGVELRRVMGKAPQKPKQLKNSVYSESVAKCGKIFGDAHPYFTINDSDKEFLDKCVKRIKSKYYGQKENV